MDQFLINEITIGMQIKLEMIQIKIEIKNKIKNPKS